MDWGGNSVGGAATNRTGLKITESRFVHTSSEDRRFNLIIATSFDQFRWECDGRVYGWCFHHRRSSVTLVFMLGNQQFLSYQGVLPSRDGHFSWYSVGYIPHGSCLQMKYGGDFTQHPLCHNIKLLLESESQPSNLHAEEWTDTILKFCPTWFPIIAVLQRDDSCHSILKESYLYRLNSVVM